MVCEWRFTVCADAAAQKFHVSPLDGRIRSNQKTIWVSLCVLYYFFYLLSKRFIIAHREVRLQKAAASNNWRKFHIKQPKIIILRISNYQIVSFQRITELCWLKREKNTKQSKATATTTSEKHHKFSWVGHINNVCDLWVQVYFRFNVCPMREKKTPSQRMCTKIVAD